MGVHCSRLARGHLCCFLSTSACPDAYPLLARHVCDVNAEDAERYLRSNEDVIVPGCLIHQIADLGPRVYARTHPVRHLSDRSFDSENEAESPLCLSL